MPYKIRKLPNKNKYRVYNSNTGEIHAHSTSLENAKSQLRLLYMIERKNGTGNVIRRALGRNIIQPTDNNEEEIVVGNVDPINNQIMPEIGNANPINNQILPQVINPYRIKFLNDQIDNLQSEINILRDSLVYTTGQQRAKIILQIQFRNRRIQNIINELDEYNL
jgi:hypothetical protein